MILSRVQFPCLSYKMSSISHPLVKSDAWSVGPAGYLPPPPPETNLVRAVTRFQCSVPVGASPGPGFASDCNQIVGEAPLIAGQRHLVALSRIWPSRTLYCCRPMSGTTNTHTHNSFLFILIAKQWGFWLWGVRLRTFLPRVDYCFVARLMVSPFFIWFIFNLANIIEITNKKTFIIFFWALKNYFFDIKTKWKL